MDHVEISEGNWFGNKPRGSYCGKKRPFDVYSSGRLMWVNFRASRDGVQANKGFKAHFEAVDLLYDEEHCLPGNANNLNLKLTGSYGTLQNPEYYPPQLYCEWLITVPKGNIVELSFERLDLDFQTSEFASSCGDYVHIHDGNYWESDTMGTFCGNVIPKPLKSIGRYMYISFHADVLYDTPRRGYKATFKAVTKQFCKLAMLKVR
ncbi:bone morphogenetic protein 1 homolog [Orbicella faveolata]|uniref:bone morphogenetic protein 1 homolog n=1 Tax=Orbicella faveolata TaxID=48498 RepID=UPI0009E1E46C|nr:bone morphogenetic protein 1 homolog [Orbicella faveolata]